MGWISKDYYVRIPNGNLVNCLTHCAVTPLFNLKNTCGIPLGSRPVFPNLLKFAEHLTIKSLEKTFNFEANFLISIKY